VEKLVYLLWARPGQDGDALRETLLREAAPRLLELGARTLTVSVADSEAAVPLPVAPPAGEPLVAAEVSLFVDCHDRRQPFEAVLAAAGGRLAGYLVSEALYRDYGGNRFSPPRDWPEGRRSPGVLMLTLLERPGRLQRDAWIAHWHGVQSPVSEEIQPRMRYVRNEWCARCPDAPTGSSSAGPRSPRGPCSSTSARARRSGCVPTCGACSRACAASSTSTGSAPSP
jgi:hypothetical protein